MKRMNLFALAVATGAGIAAVSPADAQFFPLSAEVRGGAAFPTGDFGEGDVLDTGWGFEVNGELQVAPGIGVYGAYDRYAFSFEDDALLGLGDGDLVDQGFALGGRLTLPMMGLSPWLRAGGIYNKQTIDLDGSGDGPESDYGLGYEVGGGLTFPLGMVIAVTPGVRYRSYSPGDSGDENISYIVGDIGMRFSF
jgi:hypothetical protein